jgi:hypothetical protein
VVAGWRGADGSVVWFPQQVFLKRGGNVEGGGGGRGRMGGGSQLLVLKTLGKEGLIVCPSLKKDWQTVYSGGPGLEPVHGGW